MKSYFYDLHNHSCLSPCGDRQMTPASLAGMAKLAGLELVALTDHNTCQNCPAFFRAAHAYGIIPVAGMELTCAEEIHLVCLFATLEDALAFEDEVRTHRPAIENVPAIFGEQTVCDENDAVIGEDAYLLTVATDLSLTDAARLVTRHGGACFPAHVDRESGGIIAILGAIPEDIRFSAVEFRDSENIPSYREKYRLPHLVLCDSDSHYLDSIPDARHTITLSGETEQEVRRSLIDLLRHETL